jgi:hypothetical protein
MARGIAKERYADDLIGSEINSDDVFGGDGVLDYTSPGALMRSLSPSIEPVTEREFADKAEYERFMQDPVVIVIHKTAERHEAPSVMVGNNGNQAWLPRGQKIKVPRYFVETLARSQTRQYATEADQDPNAAFGMRVRRFGGLAYPFSVVADRHPKGDAWLQRVMRESA